MATVTGSVRIQAARDAVWRRLARLDAVNEYHPRVEEAAFVSKARDAPGAEVEWRLPEGRVRCRVASWDEGQGLVLDVVEAEGLPLRDAHVAFRIEEAGDIVVVSEAVVYRPKGPLGPLRARSAVRRDFFLLEALKQDLERGSTPPPAAVPSKGAQKAERKAERRAEEKAAKEKKAEAKAAREKAAAEKKAANEKAAAERKAAKAAAAGSGRKRAKA